MTERKQNISQQAEVDANYEYFQKNLEKIKTKYPNGKFVLLHNRSDVGCFDTFNDAYEAGRLLYGQNQKAFSIQDMTPPQIELGFQSHALV